MRVSRFRVPGRVLFVAGLAAAVSGHVGTDDVFFVGDAGPWDVRVTIRQPGVIPGLADITVRVENGSPEEVSVTALRRFGDDDMPPPPDVARPVPGAPGTYAAELWLMVRGPHSVFVNVEGNLGDGTAMVPVVAKATRRLAMTRALAVALIAGAIFLIVGMITIVGAATRESVLPPGEEPDDRRRRRARWTMVGSAFVIGLVLLGGWRWVEAEDAAYRALIDRAWSAEAEAYAEASGRILDFRITDSLWVMRDDPTWLGRAGRFRRSDLVPDHGKLMHMFLAEATDLSAFAHVHPIRQTDELFSLAVPDLPAGDYHVFADLVHEDGTAHTVVTTTTLPAAPPQAPPDEPDPVDAEDRSASASRVAADPDDAAWTATGPIRGPGSTATTPDGSSVAWEAPADGLEAGVETDLVFRVRGPDGGDPPLEPYMGMAGHAMVMRTDGQIFLHLHPAGMISMAAQQALMEQEGGGDMAGMAGMTSETSPDDAAPTVRFPVLLPEPGAYRIWVQLKLGGDVTTVAFDTAVR